MFFNGPKILIFLRRSSFEIYYKDSDKILSVKLPSSALRHLEIVSREEITQIVIENLKHINLTRQQAIIALSDSIVFERLIADKDPATTQKQIKDFFDNIPLEETHIARKVIPLKGSVLALAANKQFYQLIIDTVSEFEWKIKTVLPMIFLSKVGEQSQLTPEQVSLMLSSEKKFAEANFLDDQYFEKDESATDKKVDPQAKANKTKNIVIIALALFLVSFIVGSLIYFKMIILPFSKSDSVLNPSPAASESSESAQVSAPEATRSANTQVASVSAQLNRGDIKIHVLNGSGIAGQANKLKEKLAEIGYENVISGNIEGTEASQSTITYSSNVDNLAREEINTLMDSLIGEAIKVEDTLNEFNVLVILGKLASAIN